MQNPKSQQPSRAYPTRQRGSSSPSGYPSEYLDYLRQDPCQDHGRLVLDLALGRLDDDRARVAERARQTCPSCRSWWEDSLEGEPAVEVDRAVAEAFASFEAPRNLHRSSHQRLWLAAAAVFVVAVLGLLLEPGRGGKSSLPGGIADDALADGARPPVTSAVQATGETSAGSDRIFAADFESGTVGETDADPDRIFAGFETGAGGETDADPGRIFAENFESGDMASWSL